MPCFFYVMTMECNNILQYSRPYHIWKTSNKTANETVIKTKEKQEIILFLSTSGNLRTMKWVQMSRLIRKPTFRICENKGTDQLRSQRLCFPYTDSTIPLLSKSKISGLWPSSVLVQLGLCRTCSETKCWFSQDTAQMSSRIHRNISIHSLKPGFLQLDV